MDLVLFVIVKFVFFSISVCMVDMIVCMFEL